MAINIDVVKDSEGLPSIIVINDGGRIATIIHDDTKGFTIKGSRRIAQRWFPLLFPVEKQTTLSIPEPLEVVSIVGGKILLHDGIEDLLKWYEAAATVAVDNTFAFTGDQSLKITCGAAAANAQAQRDFGLPHANKISFECKFTVDDYSKLRYLAYIFSHDTGNESIDARIHFDGNNLKWQFLNSASSYEDVMNATVPVAYYKKTHVGGGWNYIKLIIDYVNKGYESLQINDKFFDLSNYNFRTTGTGGNVRTYCALLVDNDAGQEVNVWFDDIIIKEVA